MQKPRIRLILFVLACLTLLGGLSVSQGQIQFNRPKDADPLLDNPYTFAMSREALTDFVKQTLKDNGIPLDEEKSKIKPGMLYTKPVVFTKGGPTKENLEFCAKCPGGDVRNWLRGRFTLQIEIAPVDPQRTKLFVFARVEGEYQEALGGQWVECPSRGIRENDLIKLLVRKDETK